MKYIRAVITIVLLAGLFIAYYYDVPKYLAHFVVGMAMLVFEIYDSKALQQRIAQGDFFKTRSNVWTEAVITTSALLYFFSDQPMNIWNIAGISALLLSGISKAIRGTSANYRVTEDGIWNLHTNLKFISAENITDLRITTSELSVDTKKYKNNLLVKANNLRVPTWDKLTKDFIDLEKTWVNNR